MRTDRWLRKGIVFWYIEQGATLILEALVFDLDGDLIAEVLVLEDDVDLDLALVVLVADAVEVVIDDLLQVVLLDAL